MTDWEHIRQIAGPKGTYLFGSLRRLPSEEEGGAEWFTKFCKEADENGMTVRTEQGRLYLDMKD